jgi:hypothetical protein
MNPKREEPAARPPLEAPHMKVEQLSDLALDCIHSAARALEGRYRPAFYGEVAKGLEMIETDALFVIRGLVASAQRQVTRSMLG